MAKGWIISVTYFRDGVELHQAYDVAIADSEVAVSAVKRLVAPISNARVTLQE